MDRTHPNGGGLPKGVASDDVTYETNGRDETRGYGVSFPPSSYRPPSEGYRSVTSAEGIRSIRDAKRSGAMYKRFPLRRTGGVAIVRRPSLLSLAVGGQVPQHLRKLVDEMVMAGVRAGDRASAQDEFLAGGDPLAKMADLVRATAIAGFVDPKLVEDGRPGPLADDTMYVGEIDIDDLQEYFLWCQRDEEVQASTVATFPREQTEPVLARSGGSPVRSDAV